MKNLKLLVVALVAMFGFIACDQHECNDYDHSADIVGTWTCLREDFAEALVIKADGSVLSTGSVFGEEYWEDVKGNIVLENGNISMTFEDGDNYKGHFDIIPGKAFSICNAEGRRFTYDYCANDLSDEIVGMWVCNDAPAGADNDMAIISYANDGSTTFTGILPNKDGYMLNVNTTYNVVGDLMFKKNAVQGTSDSPKYISTRLTYAPNGTGAGDIMVYKHYNGTVETSSSYLRVKSNLELAGNKYDYIKTFVSNVKGVDKDVDVMGYTFNFAKMDGVVLDKMLKTVLFAVEFPDANTIRYSCKYNEFSMEMDAPIVVDGNKMTVKMSQRDAAYKDVDLYTFQDQDNSQMHMYMHTTAFVNFFGNMQIAFMSELGQLDKTDANAVKAVFDGIDAAVESINLSLVMTKAAK
jgi:hypothetical protein